MKRFDEIRDLVMSLEGDFEKFYDKGNQAAGTRVRKGMQDLKNLAQEIRVQVQNQKNTATASAPAASKGSSASKGAASAKKAPAKKAAAKK
jgi:hypothetical protein